MNKEKIEYFEELDCRFDYLEEKYKKLEEAVQELSKDLIDIRNTVARVRVYHAQMR